MGYDKDKIRKIARMLESEHAGEVASAAGMLLRMAKAEGHNLDEMLAAVYGGLRPPNESLSSSGFTRGYNAGMRDASRQHKAVIDELNAEVKRLRADFTRRDAAQSRASSPTLDGVWEYDTQRKRYWRAEANPKPQNNGDEDAFWKA